MRKLISLVVFMGVLSFSFIQINNSASAELIDGVKVYKMKKGETLLDKGKEFGVSEKEIKIVNFLKDDQDLSGKKIIVPKPVQDSSITPSEKELLARLVHAEAEGEPFKGKVAVAEVVLNRVESDQFPDTIKEVIYEDKQFQPVDNGTINQPAGDEAKQAVKEAIQHDEIGKDSLYFYNPNIISSTWLQTRTVTFEIGNHRFAK
ncbi:cell wall hydrolase [Cytobacillus spongiae]|uniref:cell wall hydrolase n=1 Tax=Cytobacillus spongiae TaxID=2901381 RepID=UPI001F25C544|nr:cell wall hydrolase [Cytobacillus spongiae]UII57130.1 cell wall hydrolase [Cytobacillus spongiae]